MGTKVHHTKFGDVSFYGPFEDGEREKLLSLIEKIESESNKPHRGLFWYWACCCWRSEETTAYFLSCSGYPDVLVGESVDELIEEARSSFRPLLEGGKQG